MAPSFPSQLQTENEIELAYADSAVTFYPVIRDDAREVHRVSLAPVC